MEKRIKNQRNEVILPEKKEHSIIQPNQQIIIISILIMIILSYILTYLIVHTYLPYRTYLPTLAKESTIKIMNTPRKQYNTNSSVILLTFSSLLFSMRVTK